MNNYLILLENKALFSFSSKIDNLFSISEFGFGKINGITFSKTNKATQMVNGIIKSLDKIIKELKAQIKKIFKYFIIFNIAQKGGK